MRLKYPIKITKHAKKQMEIYLSLTNNYNSTCNNLNFEIIQSLRSESNRSRDQQIKYQQNQKIVKS